MREYFAKLAQTEHLQQKLGFEMPKTGKNSQAGTVNTPFNGQNMTQSIGIAAQSSFDVSHLNQIDGQMQITLEAPEGHGSLDQDHEREVPTQLISPEANIEIGTEDPTLQKADNTASENEIQEEDDGNMQEI